MVVGDVARLEERMAIEVRVRAEMVAVAVAAVFIAMVPDIVLG